MAKKPSLTAALQSASGQNQKEKIIAEEAPEGQTVRPSRQGKKAIIAYFDPAVSKQLRQIALDEESTVQDLMREAINDLFQKRGKSAIA